jgi:hypothetical protein
MIYFASAVFTVEFRHFTSALLFHVVTASTSNLRSTEPLQFSFLQYTDAAPNDMHQAMSAFPQNGQGFNSSSIPLSPHNQTVINLLPNNFGLPDIP